MALHDPIFWKDFPEYFSNGNSKKWAESAIKRGFFTTPPPKKKHGACTVSARTVLIKNGKKLFVHNAGNARQLSAFAEFEHGTTGGGNVAHIPLHLEFVDCRHGITASN